MGEAVTTPDMNYLSGVSVAAPYELGPSYSAGSSPSWLSGLKSVTEAVTMAGGAITKGYAKYSSYGREALYLDTEASMAALDARLAAQETGLYDLQGDTIAMQHEINRFQIRKKYIKKFSESRAKLAKAGVNVWTGSSASVLSYLLEQEEREVMVDRMSESARMFTEVTLPKFRAEQKAIAYGFRSTQKELGADLARDAQKTSLLSDVMDFGTKLTERYA